MLIRLQHGSGEVGGSSSGLKAAFMEGAKEDEGEEMGATELEAVSWARGVGEGREGEGGRERRKEGMEGQGLEWDGMGWEESWDLLIEGSVSSHERNWL
jgi:hypothetical protein